MGVSLFQSPVPSAPTSTVIGTEPALASRVPAWGPGVKPVTNTLTKHAVGEGPGDPNEKATVRVSGVSVSQLPSWQEWPTPQTIPFALFGWVQCPLPSQTFLVQGLLSS